ncbi:LysR family transcriptional regulator [Vibrio furnissii]|uniref:LysR family transcriptional regulator n=1 Tax=Vibrio furnissii TaxID=29494 RepID=UPI0003121D4F|nr:LysR family transcriptional regulator [Vibrio furnissii]SUQ32431.1 transcriptional regulator [Vibrio furnissii]
MLPLSQRITLKMLRYFYQVAQCQQFSQAAEQLNITKSPLSAQIKELEQALGVVLFERDTRNVRLTTAGKQLNQECERIFDVLETSLNRVAQSAREEQATLNLGLMSSIFWAGFGDALHQLQQTHPTLTLNLLELSPEKQKQALLQHHIDIGLVRYADTMQIAPLHARSLYQEKMVVALPTQHALAARKQLSLQELRDAEFVMLRQENSASTALIRQHCQQAGFEMTILQEVVEPNTLLAVISTRGLLSIVPASYANLAWPHVRFVALKETIRADICALSAKASHPLTDALLNQLSQALLNPRTSEL